MESQPTTVEDDLRFERFAARVAKLTPAERSALVAAHRHPESESARQWGLDQRLVLEFCLDGSERLEQAYTLAGAFGDGPVAEVILEIGLVIIDPPDDSSVAEIALSGWGAVIGWSGVVSDARQIEAWPETTAGPGGGVSKGSRSRTIPLRPCVSCVSVARYSHGRP